jgi:hypothetical protein
MKPSCNGPQLSQIGGPQQRVASHFQPPKAASRRTSSKISLSGGNDAVAVHHDYPFNNSERKVEVVHHNDAEPVSPTPNQIPQTKGRRSPSSMPCVFEIKYFKHVYP